MNDLKYLSEELDFERDFEPSLSEYLIEPYGDFPSGKVVGYRKLDVDDLHILCFDKSFYLFNQGYQIHHHKLSPQLRFIAYMYVPTFRTNNDECFPVHVFYRSDGKILLYKIDILSLKFRPIDTTSSFGDFSELNFQSIAAAPRSGVYVSQVGNTMYKCSFFDPVHPLGIFSPMERGTIYYSTFFQDGNVFFCAYQSVLNGETIVEFSKLYSTTDTFTPVERASLGILNYDNTVIKKIDEKLILCLTPTKTWNFESTVKVSPRRNEGLPNSVRFFNVIFDPRTNSVRLHTASDVFEATHRSVVKSKHPIRWSLKKVHSISQYSGSIVDFSYELQEYLHIIIYARGLAVIVNSLTLKTSVLNCTYENKFYFAGEIASNQGSDLTTTLLCGASGDRQGFFEKRFLQYPICKGIDPFSSYLRHLPVTNLWYTRKGIFYESMGIIYNSKLKSDVGEEGIWVLKSGEVLHAMDDRTLIAVSNIGISEETNGTYLSEKDLDLIGTIDTNGTLRLLQYVHRSRYNELLQLQLGNILDKATVISASYDSKRKILHVVAFIDCCKIVYWDNKNRSCMITVGSDFLITGLKVINNYAGKDFSNGPISNILVAAAGLNGQMRIYSLLTEEVMLEFKSSENSAFQMVKFLGFIIFYNDSETILLRTNDLIYGNLVLPGIIPYKIVHLENNKICVLDNDWTLKFLEIPGTLEKPPNHKPSFQSQYREFGDYLPLRLSLIPSTNLVAIALKNSSTAQRVRLILFDYNNFETLKSIDCVQNEVASDVLLISCSDRLILSCYKRDHSIVKIFDFQLNLLQEIMFNHRITSIHFRDSHFVFDGCEEVTYEAPRGVPEKFPQHFDRPSHSNYRMVYETSKKPQSLIRHHSKKGGYQARDVDILIDFFGPLDQCTLPSRETYKLYQTFDNRILIDNFEGMIPYDILSITPIKELMYNVQNGIERSQYIRPLFLITCAHNSVYILCARYKEPGD